MKSVLRFNKENAVTIPHGLQELEERFSENLIEYFFEYYTKPGDIILDPFAGLGTTMVVAQRMDRNCYGFEPNKERYNFAQSQLHKSTYLFNASALNIKDYNIPIIDFSISSPPYTNFLSNNNPLRNSTENNTGSYKQFLSDIRDIYSQVKNTLKRKGYCVIEVSNMFDENHNFFPLAWDVAREVTEIMPLRKEIIIEWDKSQYGLTHTYCFVFQNI